MHVRSYLIYREKIAQLSACKPSLRTDARTGKSDVTVCGNETPPQEIHFIKASKILQAEKKFLTWQQGGWFSPGSALLAPGKYTVLPVMLPFWIFRVHAQIMYNASVGIRSNSSTNSLIWKDIGRRSVTRQYSEQTPQLQVQQRLEFQIILV